MKKKIVISLFAFCTLAAFSQQKRDVNNFIIKLNYGLVNSEPLDPMLIGTGIPVIFDFKPIRKANFGIDLDYKFSATSEAGVYFNYSELFRFGITQFLNTNGEQSWTYNLQPTKTLYYGLNYLYDIPILKGTRLEFYSILRTGFVSEKYLVYHNEISGENYSSGSITEIWDKPEFEIGLGAGVNYYLLRNLGVFAEAQGGKFHNNQLFKWRTGIVIKL